LKVKIGRMQEFLYPHMACIWRILLILTES